jgi:hypothetical protein
MSFERRNERDSFGSVVRSLELYTCESRFKERSVLKFILVQKQSAKRA